VDREDCLRQTIAPRNVYLLTLGFVTNHFESVCDPRKWASIRGRLVSMGWLHLTVMANTRSHIVGPVW
jgi:hypothetical protein